MNVYVDCFLGRVHRDVAKNFACLFCPSKFYENNKLETHMRKHTGDKRKFLKLNGSMKNPISIKKNEGKYVETYKTFFF